ncbi:MAG: response regulator [Salinibacterium sp.]|nr:response regulator [Salinibacterium sp.]
MLVMISMSHNHRALVVDDDAVTRILLCRMLHNLGWGSDEAGDVPEALQRLTENNYGVVIADFNLPSGTGLDILAAVQAKAVSTPTVLITSYIEYSTLPEESTLRLGGQLTKPVSSQMLADVLERLSQGAGK